MSNKPAERPAGKTRLVSHHRNSKKQGPARGLAIRHLPGRTGKKMNVDFKPSTSAIITRIEAGLVFQDFAKLRKSLDVSAQKLADKLGISKATLQRRKLKGRFDLAESERLVRFARLVGKAVEVMGSVENGRRWLNSPQYGLGGAIPLDYARTEIGAREVEDLLGRIEYGVYS